MWVNKVQDAFVQDYQIMNIVFQTIDNEMMEWKDASACCPTLDGDSLAQVKEMTNKKRKSMFSFCKPR